MGQIDDNNFTIKEDGTINRGDKINSFKKKIVENEVEAVKKDSAGFLGIIISFLFPLVGIICYFVMKEKVANPESYLYSAIIGFILGVLMLFL
jgi:hypothetical protein